MKFLRIFFNLNSGIFILDPQLILSGRGLISRAIETLQELQKG